MNNIATNTVEASVSESDGAQTSWRRLSPRIRAGYVRRIRQEIAASQLHLAEVISDETSRPVTDVLQQEITASLGMLRFLERRYPRWLRNDRFYEFKPGFWSKSNHVAFDPLGVVTVIGPANFPFSIVVMQTCAAMICGNTVILKPSEKCPRVSEAIRDLFGYGRIPDGVVSVVEGGASTVERIIGDPRIAKVFFTGSTEAGRAVASLCGQLFKPCVLELGGSGPAVVCDDADLTLTARGILWSALYASGRSCIGTRRVFASPLVGEALAERIRVELGKLRRGSPGRMDVDISNDMVVSIFHGGSEIGPTEDEPEALVYAEHVLPNDNSGSDQLTAVLELIDVETPDKAVGKINDSPFGLSASIWSSDLALARRLASELQVGMVWINDASVALPQFPWGGVGASGWGRLFSRHALSEMTQLKTVSTDHRKSSRPKVWWFPHSVAKYHLTAAVNTFLFGRRRWAGVGPLAKALIRFLRH